MKMFVTIAKKINQHIRKFEFTYSSNENNW